MNRLFADEVSTQAAAAPASSDRRAALLLHAMGDADRDWALACLQPAQRARLAPLLGELRELQVPADRSWVAQVLDATPPAVDTPRQRIAAADAQRIAEALMAEPASLVQRVLKLGPWPWHDEVLAMLRARRGELFEPAADDAVSPRPALDQALLDRLAARLSNGAPARLPSATVSGALARWRNRLGFWQRRAQ